jgi:hypothetical protein
MLERQRTQIAQWDRVQSVCSKLDTSDVDVVAEWYGVEIDV